MRLKIMQVNVWHGHISRPLVELVHSEAPDLLFTQETFQYPVRIPDPSHWSTLDLLPRLEAAGEFKETFFSASFTYPLFNHTLSYGNTVFSKFPFEHKSTHYTGGPGPIHLESPEAVDHNAARNFQHAVIQAGGRSLNVINHHGHWVNQPLGDDVSVERLQDVAKYVKNLTGPVVMAGDLNLSPDSPAIQKFLAATGLTDAASRPGATTLSAAHYVERPIICDYIFISPELTLKEAKIHDTIVSDHRALTAEIEF